MSYLSSIQVARVSVAITGKFNSATNTLGLAFLTPLKMAKYAKTCRPFVGHDVAEDTVYYGSS